MATNLDTIKKQQLAEASERLKQSLKRQGISIGYKVLDDGLIISIDLETLIDAIFSKYPNVYRQYTIVKERYLIMEAR